ncbi:A/G-specific adenine glycosylase [Rapidithrix thailandica]|uniref:Adenine DNA glycosylase n=1 Tax=Rapidithrix thailandica TaxID=413964 RepID=A0AAW9S1M9_9BACT
MSLSNFAERLIQWYTENKRDLPWRHTRDPYKIWLSEVILQQTRVKQGMPYYLKFVATYPTVKTLAEASEQEVLRLWQGLGYYSRARNMHAAAKYITEELEEQFPDNYKDLLALKGVGKYTAAAIASFSFNETVAVVDGNVYRVLARIFGVEKDIASSEGQRYFAKLAGSLVSSKRPDLYNQAIMEFGAIHCKPANPDCMFCTFAVECEAQQKGLQAKLPVKLKKVKVKDRYFTYFIVEHQEQLLMKERQSGDVWQGLYDFPLVESDNFSDLEKILQTGLTIGKIKNTDFLCDLEAKHYKHVLSHQRIHARFVRVKVNQNPTAKQVAKELKARWYGKEEVQQLPKPVLIDKYLKEAVNSLI